MLPEDDWPARLGMDAFWPMHGILKALHLDNAAEFCGRTLRLGCAGYGIELDSMQRLKGLQAQPARHAAAGAAVEPQQLSTAPRRPGQIADPCFITIQTVPLHHRFRRSAASTPGVGPTTT